MKYSWTGPNGFMSNLQQPEVVDSGIYILRVEDPNGCVATKAIRISKFDFEPEVFIILVNPIIIQFYGKVLMHILVQTIML